MKTSITIPEDIVKRVRTHNEQHPESTINVSGVATLALKTLLKEYGD